MDVVEKNHETEAMVSRSLMLFLLEKLGGVIEVTREDMLEVRRCIVTHLPETDSYMLKLVRETEH